MLLNQMGGRKTTKKNVFTRSEKGRYCEQERKARTASAAAADDIDFGGGIAFS